MYLMSAAGGLALSALLVLVEMPHASEPTTTEAPRIGANSFTESQAKAWLEDAGYTHIGDLVLGTDGVWRASARLNGLPTLVRLDYKGNITKH